MRILTSGLRVALNNVDILNDIGLALEAGTVTGLIGPNGAGKSTLLRALAGLVPATSGDIRLDGQPLTTIDRRALARQIAYLPQNGPAHWNLTVEALVGLGRLPHRGAGPWATDAQAIADALAATGTTAMRHRNIDSLSGGERARALLARALATQPNILLADEPVAALDPLHQLQVMKLMRQKAAKGMTIVTVLHDLTLASRFCDRLVLLAHGRMLADGVPASVLTDSNLSEAFSIRVVRSMHEGTPFVLPWEETDAP